MEIIVDDVTSYLFAFSKTLFEQIVFTCERFIPSILSILSLRPLQIGDFGDQSYPLRIMRGKTNLELNTCPGLKIGDFGDQSYPLRILRCKTKLELNTCPGLKVYDFGDYREFINNTNGIVTRGRPSPP